MISFERLQTGELGQGTFGVVIKALDLRTQPPVEVAIKLLPRGDFVKNYKTYVKREIQNQSGLRHPLIVSIKEVSAVQSLTQQGSASRRTTLADTLHSPPTLCAIPVRASRKASVE